MKFQFKKLNREFDSEVLGWREVTAPSKILLDIPILKMVTFLVCVAFVLTGLFIPFLENFVAAPSFDVRELFWRQGVGQNFPYSIAMLWIKNLPQLVFYGVGLLFLDQAVYRFNLELVGGLVGLETMCSLSIETRPLPSRRAILKRPNETTCSV